MHSVPHAEASVRSALAMRALALLLAAAVRAVELARDLATARARAEAEEYVLVMVSQEACGYCVQAREGLREAEEKLADTAVRAPLSAVGVPHANAW